MLQAQLDEIRSRNVVQPSTGSKRSSTPMQVIKVEGELTEIEEAKEAGTLIGQVSPALTAELLGDIASPDAYGTFV